LCNTINYDTFYTNFINSPGDLYLKKVLFFILLVFLIFSCKTINVKNKETTAKILFKNLLKESEKINEVSVSGLFRIVGVKDVPPAYIQFDCQGNLKTNNFSFKISFLTKPLMEIIVDKNKVLFINHTGKQYINLNMEDIDFSKFLGINFNPVEVGYFFLGKIPYSADIEIMDFKWTKKDYTLTLTNNTSKYDIVLNSDEEIIRAKISSEYFESLNLDSVIYIKNDDRVNIPRSLIFSTEDGSIKMSFLIDKISLKQAKPYTFNQDILEKYTEVFDINEIKVIIK
jgi:hypothetical protein